MKLPICDVTPFTMQDFPNYTACILWFGGCNMRCSYCHNPELVLGKKVRLPWDDVCQFLEERKMLLDGVVLSGGECTMSPQLPRFVQYLRGLGYKIKLDTNGLLPDVLSGLLDKKQLDYVALDYKAPAAKFAGLVDVKNESFKLFQQSLQMLCASGIDFEVRTTVHTALLDEADICEIMDDLSGVGFRGDYFLQNFQPSAETIRPLPEQVQKLDISSLPTPKGFQLHARNF